MPLNGAAANTEGGRLQRSIANYKAPLPFVNKGYQPSCHSCILQVITQPPITPSESSRMAILTATMNGALINGGCVTQDRARQLLLASRGSQQYGSQGIRIAALQQSVAAASDDSPFLVPIIIPGCPPLPAPPGPPAPACPLPKNMRLGS